MNEFVKGIGRLGVVPMFEKPDYISGLRSELLFGEHYVIKKSFKDWYEIELAFDNSTGWIHASQHFMISDAYFDQINSSDYKVCTDLSGTIFFQKKYVNIVLGSILPISSNELFKLEEQLAFNGSSKSLSQKRGIDFLNEIMDLYRHAPYKPGGKTPFGIDEAGFVQQIFKISGYRLPRTLDELALGASKKNITELNPGEIVFLGNDKVTNALIYQGEGQYVGMIEGSVLKLSDLQLENDQVLSKEVLISNSVQPTGI